MSSKMRSCVSLALGFAAGIAFVAGCPVDSPSPAVAWAAEGDCGQWEVSSWTTYGSSQELPPDWHPFAAVNAGDSLGGVKVFARRCISP